MAEEALDDEEQDAEDSPKCPPQGAPAWMATFADMAGERLPANAGEDSISFYRGLRSVGENSVAPRVAMVHHGSQGRFA